MRPRQTIVLGLLLLLPVLAFLFLYGFGRNHYALPTYLPERADSVRTPRAGGGQRDTVFHRVRPFSLLAAGGRPVSSLTVLRGLCVVQLLANEPVDGHRGLVLLGADARVSQAMMRVQEKFRREPRVRLATLVPSAKQTDTSSLLGNLNEQLGTISGKWFVLAGAPDTLARLSRYELGLTDLSPKRLPFRPATTPEKVVPGRLVLLDHDQHVRGYYDGTDIHELERLITEINVLLYTYDDPH